MEKYWHVLYTKPHKEAIVTHQLDSTNIEYFFPVIKACLKKSRILKSKPYFPRYIFIHVDSETINRPSLKWMPGVVEVLNFGGQPARVPDELINLINQRVDEFNTSKRKKVCKYQKGDKVIIKNGPFIGYKGIFDVKLSGIKRAKILLKVLNDNYTRLELPDEHIGLVE